MCAGGLVSYTLAGGSVCVCAGGLVSYTLAGGRLGGLEDWLVTSWLVEIWGEDWLVTSWLVEDCVCVCA